MRKPVKKLIAGLILVLFLGLVLWDLVTDIEEADAIGFYQEKPVRLVTVAILTFLTAAVVILGDRLRRRWVAKPKIKRPPLCDKCGYNLTGNMSGICPECGKQVSVGDSEGVAD